MMNRQRTLGCRLATALIIAIGVGVVWGIVVGWLGSMVTPVFRSHPTVREYLQVAADGTPVISSQSGEYYADLSHRTLDGKQWPDDRNWLGPAGLGGPYRAPGLYYPPQPWRERLAGMNDGQRPVSAWYFVRDSEVDGSGYFVGYDFVSHGQIGYIGRAGFRRGKPPQADRFDVGRESLRQRLTSIGEINFGYPPYYWAIYPEESRVPAWFVYVIDGQSLLEVDLRERTVRTFYDEEEVVSVSTVNEGFRVPKPPLGGPEAQPPGDEGASNRPSQSVLRQASLNQDALFLQGPYTGTVTVTPAPAADGEMEWKFINRLAVRTTDAVHVIDVPTGAKRSFVMPQQFRNDRMTAYLVKPDQLLLQFRRGWWSGGRVVELAWIDREGSIQREERVELAGYVPPSARRRAWGASVIAPVPVGWAVGVGIVAPLDNVQRNEEPDYLSGLARTFHEAWPAMLAVLVISWLLTWIALVWHRQYYRDRAGVWCALVFLLGLPGLVAYWLEHRRPHRVSCGECGKLVPRDRETCAACGEPFLEPPLVGTEILSA